MERIYNELDEMVSNIVCIKQNVSVVTTTRRMNEKYNSDPTFNEPFILFVLTIYCLHLIISKRLIITYVDNNVKNQGTRLKQATDRKKTKDSCVLESNDDSIVT